MQRKPESRETAVKAFEGMLVAGGQEERVRDQESLHRILYEMCFNLKDFRQCSLLHSMFFTGDMKEFV